MNVKELVSPYLIQLYYWPSCSKWTNAYKGSPDRERTLTCSCRNPDLSFPLKASERTRQYQATMTSKPFGRIYARQSCVVRGRWRPSQWIIKKIIIQGQERKIKFLKNKCCEISLFRITSMLTVPRKFGVTSYLLLFSYLLFALIRSSIKRKVFVKETLLKKSIKRKIQLIHRQSKYKM